MRNAWLRSAKPLVIRVLAQVIPNSKLGSAAMAERAIMFRKGDFAISVAADISVDLVDVFNLDACVELALEVKRELEAPEYVIDPNNAFQSILVKPARLRIKKREVARMAKLFTLIRDGLPWDHLLNQ